MEKEVLKERLTKLVEIGLSKNKTLDFNDVNDFFAGETLTPEELEFVYTYLERKKNWNLYTHIWSARRLMFWVPQQKIWQQMILIKI